MKLKHAGTAINVYEAPCGGEVFTRPHNGKIVRNNSQTPTDEAQKTIHSLMSDTFKPEKYEEVKLPETRTTLTPPKYGKSYSSLIANIELFKKSHNLYCYQRVLKSLEETLKELSSIPNNPLKESINKIQKSKQPELVLPTKESFTQTEAIIIANTILSNVDAIKKLK